MDAEANLAGCGLWSFDSLNIKNAGVAEFMDTNGTVHDEKPSYWFGEGNIVRGPANG